MRRTDLSSPLAVIAVLVIGLSAISFSAASAAADLSLPWHEAGLRERDAAAHLLDRFAFGARPGEVERILELGLERWVELQLAGGLPDKALERRLQGLDVLEMEAVEIASAFPNPGRVLRAAQRSGDLPDGFMERMAEGGSGPPEGQVTEGQDAEGRDRGGRDRQMVGELFQEMGYRSPRELGDQLFSQKLLRAVYSENQLTEVLVDFWFNHFNVSIQHPQARVHVLSYERDAIRPNVLGSFRELLGATARHPAMLLYLDNASSRAEPSRFTLLDRRMATMNRDGFGRGGNGRMQRRGTRGGLGGPNRPTGLNENYARELLELHTLGVDGGYTQDDVIEVARAFTGWTYIPPADGLGRVPRLPPAEVRSRIGFVSDGLFVFHPGFHDAEKKVVLGNRLQAGRGLEDGAAVLDLLATHPSTARHLASKLAVRFVSDEPSLELVNHLAATFEQTNGDARRVMRELVQSAEFWQSRRAKIKSPFELAVSSLRVLGAEVREPRAIARTTARMGQPLYAYQAPTGYPDSAEFWVNTGSLLNRMNFGIRLATSRVPGLGFDLEELNGGREPESLERALEDYVALLMPGRTAGETVRLLSPIVRDPEFATRLDQAVGNSPTAEMPATRARTRQDRRYQLASENRDRGGRRFAARVSGSFGEPSPLSQVVGLILGSPEFQRR